MILVAVSLPMLMSGCGGDEEGCPKWYDFAATALTLQVPDSVEVGEAIDATISGYAGCSCTYLERVESEIVGRNWILRPIARYVDPGQSAECTRNCKLFETTVSLDSGSLPDWVYPGWVYVVVISDAPVLVDSTYVLPQP